MSKATLTLPFALLAAVLASGCCVEGYIVPKTKDITLADVPGRVLRSFEKDHDPAEVAAVERTTFKTRCAQSWERYRFHLNDGGSVTLDGRGRPAKWRGRKRPGDEPRSDTPPAPEPTSAVLHNPEAIASVVYKGPKSTNGTL